MKDFMSDRVATVKFQGERSDQKRFDNGTPQGSVLSPRLFNLLMEVLVTLDLPEGAAVYSYADDLVLTVSGEDALNKIQRAIAIVNTEIATLGLKVSSEKTKAMAFTTPDPSTRIALGGTHIEWTKKNKYLGIIIDKMLNFKDHVTYMVGRMGKLLNLMRAMTSYDAGTTAEVLRRYYVACIRSIVDYAAPALALADAKTLSSLDKLQNAAMRYILGAPNWTKVVTMLEETELLPIEHRVQQLVSSFAIKVLTSLDEAPVKPDLKASVSEQRLYPANFWPNKVAAILKLCEPHQAVDFQEDLPTISARPPWEEPPGVFILERPDRGKKHTASEQLAQDAMYRIKMLDVGKEVVYYTDGSVSPTTRKAGAGIIEIRRQGRAAAVMETAIRITDGLSSMQAELVASAGALTMAALSQTKQVIIHTDSLSALQALEQHWPADSRDLITTAQCKIKRIDDMGVKVILNWIHRHVGIHMKQREDTAALAGS